jgi:nucleoside-diphosphate-sugar epimerase
MARYLVTGAAGFIARRVIEQLIAQGHEVVGVDNLNDSYDPRLKEWRLQQLTRLPGFHFFRDDICRPEFYQTLSGEFTSFQGVIHLAARAGVRQAVEIPEVFLQTNAAGTLNLLEWCRRSGTPKLVLASTSSIYGANPPLPTPESADSCHPLQIYAASKKAAEVMAYTYHHLYGLDTTVVRFFTVYGPAGRPDMVMYRFTRWIVENEPVCISGDGSQMRGFTYLDDIADGVIKALKPLGYEIVNLGGHETITINELLQRIEHLAGKKANVHYIPWHPADVNANWADVTKARNLLGWEPRVLLAEGIPQLVNWYLEQRAWARDIPLP